MLTLASSDREIIYYFILGPCILSSIACLIIIIMFSIFPSLRNPSFKMILFLAFFDFGNAVSFMIPTYSTSDSSALCLSQSILITFFSLSGLIWTAIIALFLYIGVKYSLNIREAAIYKSLICVIIFCCTVTLFPILIEEDIYGKTFGWCWIPNKYILFRNLLFFCPVLLIIVFVFIVYCLTRRLIKRILSSTEDEEFKKLMGNRLLLYPLILSICYLPYTIKWFLETVDIIYYPLECTLIAGVFRNLLGILNFCVYVMNPRVKNKLKYCLNIGKYENYSLLSIKSESNAKETSLIKR